MMLRRLSLLILVLMLMDLATASAQSRFRRRLRPRDEEDVKKPPVGMIWVDPAIVVPVGPWTDRTGLGLGLLARADVPMGQALKGRFWATLRTGYIFHLKEGLSQVHSVPMLIGVRYSKEFGPIEVFTGFEFGGLHQIEQREVLDRIDTYSQLSFATGPFIGFRAIGFDVRGGVIFPDVIGSVSDMAVLFTLGYMPAF